MMYGQQKICGFCYVYIGQEVVVVGMEFVICCEDVIVIVYCQYGMVLGCGCDVNVCMVEFFGKEMGIVKGKGGFMYFFLKEYCYFGGNGIVGV